MNLAINFADKSFQVVRHTPMVVGCRVVSCSITTTSRSFFFEGGEGESKIEYEDRIECVRMCMYVCV